MITIYFVADLLMFAMIIYSFYYKKKNCGKYILAFSCLLWFLIFSLRGYNVGNDTRGYADFFENRSGFYGSLDYPNEDLEFGFIWFSRALHLITDSPTFLFSTLSLLQFWIIFKFYKNRGRYAVWGLLVVMIVGTNWNIMMVAARQSLATSFALCCLYLLEKNKNKLKEFDLHIWIPILTTFLLALSAHRTMIVILPFIIILVFYNFGKKISYLLILSSLVFSILFTDIVSLMLDLLLSRIVESGNDDWSAFGNRYLETYGANRMSMIGQALWAIPALVSIKANSPEKVKNFRFNSYIIATCVYLIFQKSDMVTRLNLLFILVGFACYIPEKIEKRSLLFFTYLLLTLILLCRQYIGFTLWFNEDTSIPYKFVWE